MVIDKAKQLKNKLIPGNKHGALNADSVRPAREYIENYWPKLTRVNHKDTSLTLMSFITGIATLWFRACYPAKNINN
jgi:hypothetical protein